ncbi:MAG: HEAT repeat domain-containing protein [Chitinispirillaceae bacterium]|nr:HEAT repeat domain-containing protein [Chitinispirillaceae bacterium]
MNRTHHLPDRHTRSLFVLLFICFAAAILGDSTAEALLLSRLGPAVIPRMFLFNAVALFFASGLIMSLIDRYDRGTLFLTAAIGHGVLLLCVRLALDSQAGWPILPLFTYAYIAKILLFLLFWTLANDLTDSRTAQKRFPLIAAGGTMGAIAIAFSIPGMVNLFAAENLLLIWSGLSFSMAGAFFPLRRQAAHAFKPHSDRERHRQRTRISMAGDVKLVTADPLLSGMAIVYGLVFFLLIVQHYFFYVAVKELCSTSGKIAAFLGTFNGTSMAITLVLQFSAAGALLRRFGSTRALLILPAMLIAVFFVQAVAAGTAPPDSFPLLCVIVAAMGLRIAVFDSFFSPNFQLFFSSLPGEIRGRAKLTLEGMVKPVGILSGGLWLIFGAPRCSFALNMTLCLAVAVFLAVMTFRLKSRYAASLKRFLAGVSNDSLLAGIARDGTTMSLVNQVKGLFHEGNFEVQKFLIDELVVSSSPELVALVLEQTNHPDHRVRAAVVAALGTVRLDEARAALIRSLNDEEFRVVANAVNALGGYGDAATVTLVEPFLSDPHGLVRANAAVALWRCGAREKLPMLIACLDPMLDCARPEECAAALSALGEIDAAEAAARIVSFAETTDRRRLSGLPSVYRQLVTALAKKRDRRSIDTLILLAKGAERPQQRVIRTGFSSILSRGVPPGVLLARLSDQVPQLSNILVRAIRESPARVSGRDAETLRTFVRGEIAQISREYGLLAHLDGLRTLPSVELLRHAIMEEFVMMRRETMAYALSLLDTGDTIGPVVPRLFHHDPHVRARAFEVLDNVGDIALNREVMAVLDYKETGGGVQPDAERVGAFVASYVRDANEWIRKCAAFARETLHAAHGAETTAVAVP